MANFKNNLLFVYLENILKTKSYDLYLEHINNEESFKSFSKFMILRYLTMSQNEQIRNFILTNYISLERMPEKILYKFLLNSIPKQYNSFIKYIK